MAGGWVPRFGPCSDLSRLVEDARVVLAQSALLADERLEKVYRVVGLSTSPKKLFAPGLEVWSKRAEEDKAM